MTGHGEEFAATLRERMREDMRKTLEQKGVFDDPGYSAWHEEEIARLLDALVEDGMHPVEKLIPRESGRTLAEAEEWLIDHIDEGAKCPLCRQFAKVYKRKVNAGVAAGLIAMYRQYGAGWCNLHETTGSISNHVASAAWWGLIEEAAERRDDGGRGKAWRLTDNGVGYVRRTTLIQKYARVYDGEVLGLVGDWVGIDDAIGDKFDYRELMSA